MTSGFIERQEQGEELIKAEKKLNWDVSIVSPAILTGKSGEILQINDAFTELTGFLFNEICGSPVSTYLKQVNDKYSGYQSLESPLICNLVHKELKTGSLCHCTRKSYNPEGIEEFDLIQLYPLTDQSNEKNLNHNDKGYPENNNRLVSILSLNDNLAQIIPDLLVVIDKQANIIEVSQNQNFPIPHLGRFLRKKNLFRLFPEKSLIISGILNRILFSGAPEIQTETIGSGKKKHHLRYKLISLDNNRLMAVVSDITELALTEEALLLSNERLNQLQQISGIGSWDVSFYEEPKILTWNFFELLGTKNPGNQIGIDHIRHYNLIHPDDVHGCKRIIDEAIEHKTGTYSINYRVIDPGKNTRHIHTEAQLKFSDSGQIQRWTGTLQDITTQKKAERMKSAAFQISQLIHSQHNLSHLMEAIHQIIASLMPAPNLLIAFKSESDGKITFPYCIDPAGVPDPESAIKGLIGFALGTGEPLLVSAAAIDLMINEKIIRKPIAVPESWLGIPLKAHDRVLGVITLQSYTPDITYGEDEKDILIFVSEQIALSIQRIRTDEALLGAKNQAEESSRLKSSLLANMSHELRTPMTGILGFSEILNEELEDERLKVMASTIYKSANRLMSTLNSIMDLSAIESNIDSLRIKTVSVKSVFFPLLRNLHSITSDKGLYLRTALPPSIHVLADEKLLGQLLHHLLDNAIKFTIDGGISVSTYINDSNKSEAIIRVSDTGIGIAPEHHKLIFEEFRQVSEGLSRTFEGSGLGLSLCAKIARLINARLWFESIPDKGSDFFIALPSILPNFAEVEPDPEPKQIINTQRLSRGPVPEVLIVEDNEINRRLAALYLRELCNTEMAENGYIALEKIKRKKYDAILMDINLGAGPDGMSIAHKVRMLDSYKDIPIIAVTGYTMQGDREKLLSNGCSHYLAKPYDKKTLLGLFSGILYK